jgi:UDP-GlcNAc:undecaprenyl-phosphate GlcNAc-1-phosphate transferase
LGALEAPLIRDNFIGHKGYAGRSGPQDFMRTYFTAFVIATILSLCLTPVVRRLAIRFGVVSAPGGRHIHQSPVPRLGGVAIFLALVAPLIGLFFVQSDVAVTIGKESSQVRGLLLGGGLMGLVGFVDDTRGLRALHKLYAQLLASAVAFAFGFRIDAVAIPGFGVMEMGAFALPVTMLWITGIVNAVNLIDGLDGLAAGVVFFAGVTNFVVARLAGSVFVALIMASMLGALLGFLFHNFNPARIFMGDTGSYFLGFVLATTSLAGSLQKESTAVSLLVPVVALGIPITDTMFAMVRRVIERRPLFSPDRGHIHHRLLDLGLTHRRVVLVIHGLSIILTLSAIGLALGRSWEVGLAILGASAVLVVLIRFAGYSQGFVRPPRALVDRDAQRLRGALLELPSRLTQAGSELDVWNALDRVLEDANLTHLELLERKQGGAVCVFRRTRARRAERDVIFSRHALGPEHAARYDLQFAWASEVGMVSPQADVLLQLLADYVTQSLLRLQSPFAPMLSKGTEGATDPAPEPADGTVAAAAMHAKT